MKAQATLYEQLLMVYYGCPLKVNTKSPIGRTSLVLMAIKESERASEWSIMATIKIKLVSECLDHIRNL